VTAVPLGETPSLCILCPPARAKVARPGGMTDWHCHDRLESHLGEILQRYARLTARPQGGQGTGRRAPGYGSRPPLDLHRAALRDPRTAPLELGDAHSPLNLFISWTTWMRVVRLQDPVGYSSLDALAILDFEWRYLTNAMDWITRQPWVPRFDEQVRAVVSQLRTATGEPNPRPVGTCNATLGGEGIPVECGFPIFPPRPGTLNIVCGGCGALYEPLDQIRMVTQAKTGCLACGHSETQHSNDHEARACNVRWCDCLRFADPEESVDRRHSA
jgi:hypothetical protein